MSDVEQILQRSYNEMVRSLLSALDLHGPGEAEHAERVAIYAVATAEELGMPDSFLRDLRRASLLHDVGKLAVDRTLLRKLGDLSQEDLDELKLHSHLSQAVLESLPWLGDAHLMIRHHHERWDGKGYPDGLAGDVIPLGARIIAVAEAFDHVAFGSYWKEPQGRMEALEELHRESGKQFDPEVLKAFNQVERLIQPISLN